MVYIGVINDMWIVQEEIFGLVIVVILFEDEEDVVVIVNDIEYGFVVGIWM